MHANFIDISQDMNKSKVTRFLAHPVFSKITSC